ncbi:MAG TPA: hypothetical protein PLD46_00425 [Hyphomicrobium sp.]|nr:hypothetical protein [Hyphomicrobium sp.]
MSLPPLRSAVFPDCSPKWDIVVASIFLAATTASLVSAKTMAFTVATFISILLGTQIVRGKFSCALFRQSPTTIPMAALLGLCAISLLWADEPLQALQKFAIIVLIAAAVLAAVRSIASETPANLARLGESLWIGMLIGLFYVFLRNLTKGGADSAMLPSIVHKLVKFDLGEVVRSIAPITLLIGPALLAISAGFLKPWRAVFSSAVILAGVLAIASSPHETSKVALVAWILVFGLTCVSQSAAYRMLQVAWMSACLLVVPISIFAHSQNLQNAPWLQRTAQERILIWHGFAVLTLDAPLLGHGFDMAATSKPVIRGLAELPYLQTGRKVPKHVKPFQAIHPHNAYLQVWYELGALGAGLFLASGLSILLGLSRLQAEQKPLIYATASAAGVMLFSSYGLWQLWFVGLLGFSAVACAIAIRLSAPPRAEILPDKQVIAQPAA